MNEIDRYIELVSESPLSIISVILNRMDLYNERTSLIER